MPSASPDRRSCRYRTPFPRPASPVSPPRSRPPAGTMRRYSRLRPRQPTGRSVGILNGAGVAIGGTIPASMALAEPLDAPVRVGYQHNDAFPGSHPPFAAPLGCNGSGAGMELIRQADGVRPPGTRLNAFSTLPCYGARLLAKGRRDHRGRHQPQPHRADETGGCRYRRRRDEGGRRDPRAAGKDSRRRGRLMQQRPPRSRPSHRASRSRESG